MTNETKQPGVAALPDGSGFGIMSFPLPKDHWLYADREYEEGAVEPKELPKSILTHAVRDTVVAAVRYAIRGATMCGKEMDFDPDALVQNAVYALCGPYYRKTIDDLRDTICEYQSQEIDHKATIAANREGK